MVSLLIPKQASSWAMRWRGLNVSRMQLIRAGVNLVMKCFAGIDWGGAGIQSPLKGKEGLFIAGVFLAGQKRICERCERRHYAKNLFVNEHKINFFQTDMRKQRLIIISIIYCLSMLIISSPLSAKPWKSVFLKYSGAIMMAGIRQCRFFPWRRYVIPLLSGP